MPVVRWEFEDPQTLDTYTFEVNPREGGTPRYTRSFDTQKAVAPDGQAILFEGRRSLSTSSISGVILTETEFLAMLEWFNKPYPVLLTDDLGRQFEIAITAFSPTRRRAYGRPWKHDYSIDYTILTEIT